jgi:hypothetical protein
MVFWWLDFDEVAAINAGFRLFQHGNPFHPVAFAFDPHREACVQRFFF